MYCTNAKTLSEPLTTLNDTGKFCVVASKKSSILLRCSKKTQSRRSVYFSSTFQSLSLHLHHHPTQSPSSNLQPPDENISININNDSQYPTPSPSSHTHPPSSSSSTFLPPFPSPPLPAPINPHPIVLCFLSSIQQAPLRSQTRYETVSFIPL